MAGTAWRKCEKSVLLSCVLKGPGFGQGGRSGDTCPTGQHLKCYCGYNVSLAFQRRSVGGWAGGASWPRLLRMSAWPGLLSTLQTLRDTSFE